MLTAKMNNKLVHGGNASNNGCRRLVDMHGD
jgi:hypothetical protein